MKKNCKKCNREFKTYPSRIKDKKGLFCSQNCYWQSKIGTKASQTTKDLLSKLRIGKGNSFYGKHHTKEAIRINRLSHIGKHSSPQTQFQKGFNMGIKNNNWKGGTTPLYNMIRNSFENKEWKKEVFKRDDYTCKECFKRGGKLHAHHKKAFSIILKEFLQLYSQFSPIEDKETLVRLAITYQPFWDISNGKTLCEDCHKDTYIFYKKQSVGNPSS